MVTTKPTLVLAVIALALCGVAPTSADTGIAQDSDTRSNFAVEQVIRSELNKLRNNPFINPSIDYPSIKTDVDVGGTRLQVSFTNAEVIGIKDFLINKVNFEGLTEGRLDITLMFPEVILSGTNYKIYGMIAGVLPMHSDGPFEIKLGNWNLTAWGNVFIGAAPTPSKLAVPVRLEEVEADMHLSSINVNMVNILGSLSDEFNLMLTEIGIDLITLSKPQLDIAIAKYLERVLNNILNKQVPQDLTTIMHETMEEIVTGIFNTIANEIEDQNNAMAWSELMAIDSIYPTSLIRELGI